MESRRTPEEVCADCPELLWQVHEQWERCRSVVAEIDAMFPAAGAQAPRAGTRPLVGEARLPQIPGYRVELSIDEFVSTIQ